MCRLARADVLAQDRALELLQRRARLDPELLDEQPAALPVARERLGLAAAAVEREHQLAAQLLAQRLLVDERLSSATSALVLAELELGLDPRLERVEPELREPAAAGCANGSRRNSASGRPAPERERLAQSCARGAGVVASREPLGERLEAREVERRAERST